MKPKLMTDQEFSCFTKNNSSEEISCVEKKDSVAHVLFPIIHSRGEVTPSGNSHSFSLVTCFVVQASTESSMSCTKRVAMRRQQHFLCHSSPPDLLLSSELLNACFPVNEVSKHLE